MREAMRSLRQSAADIALKAQAEASAAAEERARLEQELQGVNQQLAEERDAVRAFECGRRGRAGGLGGSAGRFRVAVLLFPWGALWPPRRELWTRFR